MEILIAAIAVISFVFILYLKRKRSRDDKPTQKQSLGLSVSVEELSKEKETIESEILLTKELIEKSGLIREEKMSTFFGIMDSLARGPFERINVENITVAEPCLSLEEKRRMGLNTRKKYSKTFIECCDEDEVKKEDPKVRIENIFLDAFHRTHRKFELDKLKKSGVVTHVKIFACNDEDDCKLVRAAKSVYPLNAAPELPLRGCDATVCRCGYEGIVD